jgi:hypothetical protein
MTRARGFVALIAIIGVGGASAAAIRQREHNKHVMRAIWSDLHNLAVAQEAYFADNAAYSGVITPVNYGIGNGSVIRLVSATDTSWEATATHPGTALVCTSTAMKKGKVWKSWYPPVCK